METSAAACKQIPVGTNTDSAPHACIIVTYVCLCAAGMYGALQPRANGGYGGSSSLDVGPSAGRVNEKRGGSSGGRLGQRAVPAVADSSAAQWRPPAAGSWLSQQRRPAASSPRGRPGNLAAVPEQGPGSNATRWK